MGIIGSKKLPFTEYVKTTDEINSEQLAMCASKEDINAALIVLAHKENHKITREVLEWVLGKADQQTINEYFIYKSADLEENTYEIVMGKISNIDTLNDAVVKITEHMSIIQKSRYNYGANYEEKRQKYLSRINVIAKHINQLAAEEKVAPEPSAPPSYDSVYPDLPDDILNKPANSYRLKSSEIIQHPLSE